MGRDYGKWKPGQRTDTGQPIKKRGRKKWTWLAQQVVMEEKLWRLLNIMVHGKKKIESRRKRLQELK